MQYCVLWLLCYLSYHLLCLSRLLFINVASTQTYLGSSTGEGCQRWFAPVLSKGCSVAHETEIPVRQSIWFLPVIIPDQLSIHRQPGQTSTPEIKKRDLRAELLAAEQEAREKKRKAEGKPSAVLAVEDKPTPALEDEETSKRRKMLQEAIELDKDDDDDESEKDEGEAAEKSGEEERCVVFN